jgi:ribosomal protein S18 acetylase RimI-like enzyme
MMFSKNTALLATVVVGLGMLWYVRRRSAANDSVAMQIAQRLGVPPSMRLAFIELFVARMAKLSSIPTDVDLADWRSTLAETRALVTVQQFIAQHQAAIDSACQKTGMKRYTAEQRFVAMGVYGKGEDGIALPLTACLDELCKLHPPTYGHAARPKILPGVFDERHENLRQRAYPYHPACEATTGWDTLDLVGPDGVLLGFLALEDGDYVDDLTVDPQWQGCGMAKALVTGAAMQMQKSPDYRAGSRLSLDVRRRNLPALELYKHLGFRVDKDHYPDFYDWHGGYEMSADVAKLIHYMPPSVDCKALL